MLDRPLALARLTLTQPSKAARQLMQEPLRRDILLEALVLVAITEVLIGWTANWLSPLPENAMMQVLFNGPILLAISQVALITLSVLAVFLIGRLFGGTGTFDQALQLIIWMQFVVQLVELALLPLHLFASEILVTLNFALAIYSIWLTVNFIAVLHGFNSLLKVLAGLIATSVVLAFVLLMVLGSLGLLR